MIYTECEVDFSPHEAIFATSNWLLMLKPEYSGTSDMISWLMMAWSFTAPGHQQPSYCKVRSKFLATCYSFTKNPFLTWEMISNTCVTLVAKNDWFYIWKICIYIYREREREEKERKRNGWPLTLLWHEHHVILEIEMPTIHAHFKLYL